MQRVNVSREMAVNAARKGSKETGKKAFIWYDNNHDGWHWDYEGSEWLGHRVRAPKTDKIIQVRS